MLRKKLLLLLLLVTLLVSVSAPEGARACSGDDCGCGIDAQICDYECQFEPPEYQQGCRRACRRASVRCAIDCCSW
ncbi:MAG TPA: hypothetical protein VF659_06190 [Pyrinomonadaceae bacterium]|jgi:hypothetical protein